MKLNANITGVDALGKKFKKLGAEGQQNFEEVTKMKAGEIHAEAKRRASKYIDNGDLSRGIILKPVSKTNYIVAATENYSAFIEFGTGRRVSIPKGWERIASEFRGKSLGTFNDGLNNIKAWAKRKGIDESAAYPIFISILKNGIEPKPFLYPAFKKVVPIYLKDLNTALKRLTNKFNK